jgi:hypothetical protein
MATVAMKFFEYIVKEIERFVVNRRFVFQRAQYFVRAIDTHSL